MAKRKRRLRLKKRVYVVLLLIVGVIIFVNNMPSKSADVKKTTKSNTVIEVVDETIYLAIGETASISEDARYKYESSAPSVLNYEAGTLTGLSSGDTGIKVTYKDASKEIKVVVTDLVTLPTINNKKEYLKCEQFSEKEADTFDKYLEYKLNKTGLNTRAAAVEAARFLSLQFPYGIEYFYENGRLVTGGTREYVDGEGRYYHKGLYLHKNKIPSLAASFAGPAIWGCPIYTKTLEKETPNGLDCSGFVTWAIYNAGFDVGDVGAGPGPADDLTDRGDKISKSSVRPEQVKVGDLIGRYGHIGIIIGIDENNYYIAEALDTDLHVLTQNKNTLGSTSWEYFILMDKYYINDGNLTNMW